MRDPRCARLAHVIVHHSIQLKPGEAVMVESFDLAGGLVLDLVEEIQRARGIPVVVLRDQRVTRSLMRAATEAQFQLQSEMELEDMKRVQCYVGLRAADNVSELADVPPDAIALHTRLVARPVHLEYRVNHTRWVVLRYPTSSMAQLAGMSTEAFEDLYFRVCTLDYGRMAEAMEPLARRMRATDRVRLKGPGTDLRFSIKGIGAVPCEGRRNLPDGECFSAPVRDSVSGTIAFNTPSVYLGTTYDSLRFTFEGGRIVKAVGNPQQRLDALLDTDEGARYFGEWSLGLN